MSLTNDPKIEKSTISQANKLVSTSIVFEQAFNVSNEANVISLVKSGRIIAANMSACKLLGYSKTELENKYCKELFQSAKIDFKKLSNTTSGLGDDKVESFVKDKTGKFIASQISSVVIKDLKGIEYSVITIIAAEKVIGRDKGNLGENDEVGMKSAIGQLENNEWISSVIKISYDLICDWDLSSNLISFGPNYEKLFGHKLPKNPIYFAEWIELFQPDERIVIETKLNSILQSESMNWEYAFKFICPDGSVSKVISRANIIRNNLGKAIRMIGIVHDVSQERKLAIRLKEEVIIKEKQIVEAIVEAKEMERSDLGKELHDNVNQLLGASMLYLDMARKDISHGETYLIHSSEYTLKAIEEIRKLAKGLTSDTINKSGLSGAILRIVEDTRETNSTNIHFQLSIALEDLMAEKFKINIFRIIQEQLNNIIKHSKAYDASITFSKKKSELILRIEDNGVGFRVNQKANGIGLSNIESRTKLYKGNVDIISKPGMGCKLVFSFPLLSIS